MLTVDGFRKPNLLGSVLVKHELIFLFVHQGYSDEVFGGVRGNVEEGLGGLDADLVAAKSYAKRASFGGLGDVGIIRDRVYSLKNLLLLTLFGSFLMLLSFNLVPIFALYFFPSCMLDFVGIPSPDDANLPVADPIPPPLQYVRHFFARINLHASASHIHLHHPFTQSLLTDQFLINFPTTLERRKVIKQGSDAEHVAGCGQVAEQLLGGVLVDREGEDAVEQDGPVDEAEQEVRGDQLFQGTGEVWV